ncbi:uncharacterized protein LOC117172684 [Belonocnema kinseyi]|uniref:uncharacterized protein LOC117172684 n=1 Tax=Belonocnema kinseyi TaxID=2817044 RepID=UPI00143D1497|nr:uncharacterized protein LOC117172684 [Belonocnema kinseyi]XP_033216711.1 uncharacterized protein LOC117172684 [Belonocnema kinseyi]XP_033216712.1 uncharacterized protein LOC117172684 [Belonocnema kinseyi]
MPKPKSCICKLYENFLNKDQELCYKCNYCGETYKNNATRQKKNLEYNGLKCPKSVKEMVRREKINSKKPVKDYLSKDDIVLSGDNLDDEESVPEKTQNYKDQQRDNHKSGTQKLFDFRKYIDCMNPEEQERLNVKFPRAIFSLDAPLPMLNNEYWLDFFHELRTSWKPPSIKLLQNQL